MANDTTWDSWWRPLILALLPAVAAGLVAWGAVQTRLVALIEDVARVESKTSMASTDIRSLERLVEQRAGDSRVLQASLHAIEARLARIEERLYNP